MESFSAFPIMVFCLLSGIPISVAIILPEPIPIFKLTPGFVAVLFSRTNS